MHYLSTCLLICKATKVSYYKNSNLTKKRYGILCFVKLDDQFCGATRGHVPIAEQTYSLEIKLPSNILIWLDTWIIFIVTIVVASMFASSTTSPSVFYDNRVLNRTV